MAVDLSSLNPDFAQRLASLRQLLADKYGLNTDLSSGMRTNDTQAQLYAQGRTAPGPIVTNAPPGSSYHNYGAAVDLIPKGMDEKAAAATIGKAFKENPDLGLTWGGSFKSLYDPFHIQMGGPISQFQGQAAPTQSASVPPLAGAGTGGAAAAPQAAPDAASVPGMLSGANLSSGGASQGGPDIGMLAQRAMAMLQQPSQQMPAPPPINYPIPPALRARMQQAALGLS